MIYFALAFVIWNLVTFVLMGIDKRRAVKGGWRIPERTLLLCAFLLGGVGEIIGALVFRHKTLKWKFRLGLPLSIPVNLILVVLIINALICFSVSGDIVCSLKDVPDRAQEAFSQSDLERLKAVDPQCALILGCSVNPDGSPSLMLKDRLDCGILLYKTGVVDRLLLSGDAGQVEYNEVGAMHSYCLSQGVPEEALLLDQAGFSTYESVYRAQSVFQVERMVIVTQKYHIFRALQIAEGLGIDSLGVCSDQSHYDYAVQRELREVLARTKDLFQTALKLPPAYTGDVVPSQS